MLQRLTLLLCGLLACSAFGAESKLDEAKRHFLKGKELYDDGDLAGALNEMERSYAAASNFKLLYNIGQIQAQQQNYSAALKNFRQYLVDGGAEVTDARRAEVLKEIDKFRTRVAELTVLTPDGAEVTVDDVVVGKAPLGGPVVVNIGKRKVAASLPNHVPATKIVDVVGLEAVTVSLQPQALVAPSDGSVNISRAEPVVEKRLPVWVPWAGAGALTVATVVVGLLAASAWDAQVKLMATFGITSAKQNSAAELTRSRALVADILGITAGAAILGSVIYTAVSFGSDGQKTVRLSPTLGGLSVSGVF